MPHPSDRVSPERKKAPESGEGVVFGDNYLPQFFRDQKHFASG